MNNKTCNEDDLNFYTDRKEWPLQPYLWLIWAYFIAGTQVEKLDSCQYLETSQYRASCKPVLDNWYRAKGWRGTGIEQPQSSDQMSAINRFRSNASTEPVQISALARYWHCSGISTASTVPALKSVLVPGGTGSVPSWLYISTWA